MMKALSHVQTLAVLVVSIAAWVAAVSAAREAVAASNLVSVLFG